MELTDKTVAGRYAIRAELGSGGTATVYRAEDIVLGHPMALKVLSAALAADPDFVLRFEREAQLAARLDHPNIVEVFDFGSTEDGREYMVMRLLEGEGLDVLLARRGPLSVSEVLPILQQIAAALDYTHASGLVHRDVKPSNVRIDSSGRATLTDFGIARALDSARLTLPGMAIGTPRYMSPEQVRGLEATFATDVYSLAVVAYEMLTGHAPFEGDGTALMHRIVNEPPASPLAYNSKLPPAVEQALARGLAKAPADRWTSAGALVDELERITKSTPLSPPTAGPDEEATVVRPRMRPPAASSGGTSEQAPASSRVTLLIAVAAAIVGMLLVVSYLGVTG